MLFSEQASENIIKEVEETASSPAKEVPPVDEVTEWYKGNRVSKTWLFENYTAILLPVKVGNRSGIKCQVCADNLNEAIKLSNNGRLPIADGIRCDGRKELLRIIDHLKSASHNEAVRVDKAKKLWAQQSDSHPWVKLLKDHNMEVVSMLIHLAVDVHNDSKVLTLSANSWPSRSLAVLHAQKQVSQYCEHGLGETFVPFSPTTSSLHYRDPNVYAEMLGIIASLEMDRTIKEMQEAGCFSIQIDGSVDKYAADSKYLTARFLDKEFAMRSVFLAETSSEIRGAAGLLDCVEKTFAALKLDKSKLTGVSTDGESANTGKKSGLWQRLKQFCERDILCIWCVAHRADLAFEDLETHLPEFRQWKINIKSLATFYRVSGTRTKELKSIASKNGVKFYQFPDQLDVRFVEHLLHVCQAIWSNLPAMRQHWLKLVDEGDAGEKATAKGFFKNWAESSIWVFMTAVIMDVMRLVKQLQKEAERSMVAITDLLCVRDRVLTSLSLMEHGPYPGGTEAQLLAEPESETSDQTTGLGQRSTHNTMVTTGKRCKSAIRLEIILALTNFLKTRINDEQLGQIKNIKDFIRCQNMQEMVKIGSSVISTLFGNDTVTAFADEICGHFASEKLPLTYTEECDDTARLYALLNMSKPNSPLSCLIQAYLTVSPSSCAPERAVSCHNLTKTA